MDVPREREENTRIPGRLNMKHKFKEELLSDDKVEFKVENGVITLMFFNPDKDDKVVEW